jgi:FtsZ-interacting cell division protein ZipA
MSGPLTWILIIIVVLVLIAVVVGLVSASRKRRETAHRERAEELRDHAATQATDLQQHDARAKETEARAAQAKAEAERKQAEAERLEAEAADRRRAAEDHREQHHETLREADELDPDVDTRHEEYHGPEGVHSPDQDRTPEAVQHHDQAGGHAAAATPHRGTSGAPADGTADGNLDGTDDGTGAHVREADSTRTVTHPDGSTEHVQDPDAPEGTHRT